MRTLKTAGGCLLIVGTVLGFWVGMAAVGCQVARALELGSQDNGMLIHQPQDRTRALELIRGMGGSRVRLFVEPWQERDAVEACWAAKRSGFGVDMVLWNGFDGFGDWYWSFAERVVSEAAGCADSWSPWNEPDLGSSFVGRWTTEAHMAMRPKKRRARTYRYIRARQTEPARPGKRPLYRRRTVWRNETITRRVGWRRTRVWRYTRARTVGTRRVTLYARRRVRARVPLVRTRLYPTPVAEKVYLTRADVYRPVLDRLYGLVRRLDPGADVLAGDVSPVNPGGQGGLSFLRQLFCLEQAEQGCTRPHATALAAHPYQEDRPPWEPSVAGQDGVGDTPAYAATARQLGLALDYTEYGYTTYARHGPDLYGLGAAQPPEVRAAWWPAALDAMRRYGVRRIHQYRLGPDPYFPTSIVRSDWTLTPDYYAIAAKSGTPAG